VPRNAERGLVWLAAADGGRAGAQLKLARLLARGDDGVTPDLAAAAARYYEMAADQGHASAAYELANLYAAGDGLPEDGARAVRLYQQAVAQGDSRAYVRIGDVHGRGQGSPGTLSRRTGVCRGRAPRASRGRFAWARPTSGAMASRPTRSGR
jgi:TPR repeat protein